MSFDQYRIGNTIVIHSGAQSRVLNKDIRTDYILEMNREMSRLIHLDLSRDLFGSSLNTANCVFLHRDENDQNLIDITNNLIEVIEKTDEHTDVRDLLSAL